MTTNEAPEVGAVVKFIQHDYRGTPCGFLVGAVIEHLPESGIWRVRVDLGRNEPPHNTQVYNVRARDIVA